MQLKDKELSYPYVVFVTLFTSVLLLVFAYPSLWELFIGAFHMREISSLLYPFLDMQGRLAAFEGHRAGVDMLNQGNPFDPMGRPNAKPSWPLHLSFLGLGVKHLILAGTVVVVGVWALVVSLIRPRRWLEVPILLAICLSPAVMLGLERANDDLVYLLLLSCIPLVLMWKHAARLWVVWLIIFLLAPAKFYPGAAFAVLILEIRNWRLLLGMMALGAVFLSGYLFVYWQELQLLSEIVPRPHKYMTHGLASIQINADLPEFLYYLFFLLLVGAGLWPLIARKWPEINASVPMQRWFILGAAAWFFCYCINTNFDYRLVFYLPMLPMLLHLSRQDASTTRWRNVATYWMILLVVAAWVEMALMHYHRSPNGIWSMDHVIVGALIKNVLLLVSAFLLAIFSGTVLRPYVRSLFFDFVSDAGKLIENKPAPTLPQD